MFLPENFHLNLGLNFRFLAKYSLQHLSIYQYLLKPKQRQPTTMEFFPTYFQKTHNFHITTSHWENLPVLLTKRCKDVTCKLMWNFRHDPNPIGQCSIEAFAQSHIWTSNLRVLVQAPIYVQTHTRLRLCCAGGHTSQKSIGGEEGLPGGSVVKTSPARQETIPGPGRSHMLWNSKACVPQLLCLN